MENIPGVIVKYLDLMKKRCKNTDPRTCGETYCDECMLEEFLKLVKENVYYYDDVLDFLKRFNDNVFDLENEEKYHCSKCDKHDRYDCLICFVEKADIIEQSFITRLLQQCEEQNIDGD